MNRPGAVTIRSAICATSGPVAFTAALQGSAVVEAARRGDNETSITVPCGPLQSYLSPLGVRHVDMLSLDVEGFELIVLESLDWNELAVATIIVEEFTFTTERDAARKNQRNAAVHSFLARRGFVRATTKCFVEAPHICDHYFVHPRHYDMLGMMSAFAAMGVDDPFGGRTMIPVELSQGKCRS